LEKSKMKSLAAYTQRKAKTKTIWPNVDKDTGVAFLLQMSNGSWMVS
jgi:hypothetical protein